MGFLKSWFLRIPGYQKPWPYVGRLQQTFVCLCIPRLLDLLRISLLSLKHRDNIYCSYLIKLEDKARYAGLLLAPEECFSRGRGLFYPSGEKKPFYAVLAHFWFLVLTLVTFISSLSHFQKNQKFRKKKKKIKT